MPDLLLTNIKSLHQVLESNEIKTIRNGLSEVPSIENAFLKIEGGKIVDYGSMERCPACSMPTFDLAMEHDVIPSFIDSHTHAVHAATREKEFEQKLKGWSYEQIAASGGGILNSARALNEMEEEELFQNALQKMADIIRSGTGAIEIKSGYGLSVEGELKMLRVIRRLGEALDIPVKSTFLGAHALPKEYRGNKEGYLKLIEQEMMPNISKEGLADYIDIFCEQGFFDEEDTAFMIELGLKYGLKAKIHTNQFHSIGGIEKAIQYGILSVDHLECLSKQEIDLLVGSNVVPVFLPGAAFFLNMDFPPGRAAIDAGLAPVLASDFNPGSSPCYSMSLMQSLACVKMRWLPQEAFNACTINAAHALELETEYGSISKGKWAQLIVLKKNKNIRHISYEFGSDLVDRMIIKGKIY